MIKVVIVILLAFNILACEPMSIAAKKIKTQQQTPFTCLSSQSQCEINSEFGHFNIQFSGQIEQGRIKTEMPFQVQLKFDADNEKHQLLKVSSYLEGKTMYMGKIPVIFKSDAKTENTMVAETLLASCSQELMTWRLWFQLEIVAEGEIKQQSIFVDFESKRL